ncbi:putative membrane protein [Silvibacterium bohemicum]|uniref:Putative membrane protein n=1 Tax=Silvibacterium bohemicum TaxID=1577686 RepID=A0A841JV48_9BACT|nr:DUF2339 domain-containing protein [Silvibacterium bohemicum]MBB6142308.1 putative membrane protein [Silvibacterium bohemicum]
MSSENEELRQQIADLKERVARLEARFVESPVSATSAPMPAAPMPAALWPSPASPAANPPKAPRAVPSQADNSGRSLESRIGSQLFNRIGIVAVLIGAAWFLKLAIDNRWIGPPGRVIVGLVAGACLIAFSERFRITGYRAFSYSLKAIATGVLYLSMWAAYALFHLVPGSAAFVAMILITAMNALMCWMQNSEVLAFYAAIGGFITPMLLSVHVGNELTLFSYLLVLDIAVVALITLRPWSRLLIAAFAGTTFYAVGWYASDYADERFGLTLFFILAFFLIFAISPQLLRSLRFSTGSGGYLIEDSLTLRILPALNATIAFLEVFILLSNPQHLELRHWIALPFAAFYLGMLRLGRQGASSGAPVVLPSIYLILSVFFITLAIPMEAHGRWIAIGWFLEFAILLWFAAKRNVRVFRPLAICLLALGVVALVMPTAFFNPPAANTILLNTRFATYAWAIAACLFAARLAMSKSAEETPIQDALLSWRSLAGASGLTATLLLMIAVCIEIHAYWASGLTSGGNSIDEQFSYSAWFMLSGAALLAAGFWKKSAFLRWQGLVLLALSIAKVFLFDTRQLSQGYRIFSFLGLGALLLTVSFAYQKDWLSLRSPNAK